ncbi:hypothetical protein HS125_08725 [bacterium]|nr:hypothetical protein [bacterium]
MSPGFKRSGGPLDSLRPAHRVPHPRRPDHGVSYHPGRDYYNKVYYILDRLWDRETFRQNPEKFDRARGSLRNWLLAFQVVNTVRDWLKCRDAEERQSRLESITACKHVETVWEQGVENLPDPHPPEPDGLEEPDRAWMNGLPIRDQALLSLLYLAYGPPPAEVLDWLAELHGCRRSQMQKDLAARRQALRESPRFARHDELLARLGVAADRAQWFEHLVQTTKEEFFHLGGNWEELEICEAQARQLNLGDLDRRVREARGYRLPEKEQCLYRYAAFFRRAHKWEEKRRELRERLNSDRVFVALPFSELAELLKTPEKTLRNRLTLLKKSLE